MTSAIEVADNTCNMNLVIGGSAIRRPTDMTRSAIGVERVSSTRQPLRNGCTTVAFDVRTGDVDVAWLTALRGFGGDESTAMETME